MIQLSLNLYGAFRQLGVTEITLTISEISTVADLRNYLEKYLEKFDVKISKSLIKSSAFATDERVLKDCDAVIGLKSLSILPPVCGG